MVGCNTECRVPPLSGTHDQHVHRVCCGLALSPETPLDGSFMSSVKSSRLAFDTARFSSVSATCSEQAAFHSSICRRHRPGFEFYASGSLHLRGAAKHLASHSLLVDCDSRCAGSPHVLLISPSTQDTARSPNRPLPTTCTPSPKPRGPPYCAHSTYLRGPLQSGLGRT